MNVSQPNCTCSALSKNLSSSGLRVFQERASRNQTINAGAASTVKPALMYAVVPTSSTHSASSSGQSRSKYNQP
jgi:hypothetical protein